VHRSGVGEMELGPVGEHDPDGVAAPHPERRQAGGNRPHPLRVLTPADADLVAFGPDRVGAGILSRGHLEGRRHGRRIERLRPRSAVCCFGRHLPS
jgi:hypothetical protein